MSAYYTEAVRERLERARRERVPAAYRRYVHQMLANHDDVDPASCTREHPVHRISSRPRAVGLGWRAGRAERQRRPSGARGRAKSTPPSFPERSGEPAQAAERKA